MSQGSERIRELWTEAQKVNKYEELKPVQARAEEIQKEIEKNKEAKAKKEAEEKKAKEETQTEENE